MIACAVVLGACGGVAVLWGQAPVTNDGPGAAPPGPGGGGGAGAFPARPKADPDVLARGKAAYSTNCAYCHGDDARGGDNGAPNLLRSDYVMKEDVNALRVFLGNAAGSGHTAAREGTLRFNFSDRQLTDILSFVRDFRLNSRDPGRMRPLTVVVGDAKAGQSYFTGHCATCHAATGDMKGIASKYPDPRTLQQTWLMPVVYGGRGGGVSSSAMVSVAVTLDGGKKVEGKLGRIDDFIVTLTEADGTERSFRRDGDRPKVELHDPMAPHRDMLRVYTDKDIHDVTAYLVTLK
jgi:mono/diheme cytochrome c family protein